MKKLLGILLALLCCIPVSTAFADENDAPDLFGIAFREGICIAVGEQGTILRSEDGSTWTRVESGTGQVLRKITAWGAGFAAVGEDGTILISGDGILWEVRYPGITQQLNDIVWNGKQLVAVGMDGLVLVSNDGVQWKTVRSATGQNLTSVHWDGTRFSVTGSHSIILASNDGITWEEISADPTSTLEYQDMIFDGQRYYIMGDHLKNAVSEDLVQWNEQMQYDVEIDAAVSLFAGVYQKQTYVEVGKLGTILSSKDGTAWTLSPQVTRKWLYDVTGTGEKFIAVGENSRILVSEDGYRWQNLMQLRAEQESLKLKEGETADIRIFTSIPGGSEYEVTGAVQMQMSDTKLAAVSENTLRALGAGEGTLTVEYDTRMLNIPVTVIKAPEPQKEDDKTENPKDPETNGETPQSSEKNGVGRYIIPLILLALVSAGGYSLLAWRRMRIRQK